MQAYKRSLLVGVAVVVMLWTLGTASCTNSTKGLDTDPVASGASEPGKSLSAMLSDVSHEVGKVTISEGSGEHQICVLEEKHTSVAGQFEIALMLLRLYDRHGLRHIALEGLTKDKEFPSVKWFRDMGGPQDAELKEQIAVELLREGEISAVELIAMVLPDVVVHAADDPAAYGVELTERATRSIEAYLYKIAAKSVGREHQSRDYVISLDPWTRQQAEELSKNKARSIEEFQQLIQTIEKRAASVDAQLSDEDRAAMAAAHAFFDAARTRTKTMTETALSVARTAPLVAMNVGAAHTSEIVQILRDAKATYGVLKPLSLDQNREDGDLSYQAFERKNKYLSVTFPGKGLGSLLDGRRKSPPGSGRQWNRSATALRFVTAQLALAGGGGHGRGGGNGGARSQGDAGDGDRWPIFVDPNLKKEIDKLEDVKVNWETVRRKVNGDVFYKAAVLGEQGWINISTLCGRPDGKNVPMRQKGQNLEKRLKEGLDKVKNEKGKRVEPEKTPVVEVVTPDVSAAYAREPKALAMLRITG